MQCLIRGRQDVVYNEVVANRAEKVRRWQIKRSEHFLYKGRARVSAGVHDQFYGLMLRELFVN